MILSRILKDMLVQYALAQLPSPTVLMPLLLPPACSWQQNARTWELIKSTCRCLLSVSQALEMEIHASNGFTFSNQRQTAVSSFWVLRDSSVVSSTSWYFLLLYALCGKIVLERFQFRYDFSRPSSHHQAYVAVAGDSDGHYAFQVTSRVGLWNLSLSCQCDLSPAWINSNSLELKGAQCPSAIQYGSVQAH